MRQRGFDFKLFKNVLVFRALYNLYKREERRRGKILQDPGLACFTVSCQRLVRSEVIEAVMPGPALLTEVLEAADATAEQRAWVTVTDVTDAVLKVRLDLDLRNDVSIEQCKYTEGLLWTDGISL